MRCRRHRFLHNVVLADERDTAAVADAIEKVVTNARDIG